jgi:hypothetical protein
VKKENNIKYKIKMKKVGYIKNISIFASDLLTIKHYNHEEATFTYCSYGDSGAVACHRDESPG